MLPNILIFFCFSLRRDSFLLLVSRVSFLLSSHFLASVLVSCLRCVHRWSVRSSSRVTVSASAVHVVLTVGLCCWHTVCSGSPFFGRASICLRSTGSSAYCLAVWRAAHCTVHRGQPQLRRHQPVSTLVEASGCCCRGSRLINSRSVCLRRGEHPSEARRSRSVNWLSYSG